MFIARQSNHIQEDIKRNWSSFNYGLDGFEGTEEELEAEIERVENNESNLYISGLEIWHEDISNHRIEELYSNYWVVVDERNHGLSSISLESDTLEEAIQELSENEIDLGSEEMNDCRLAKVVWSDSDNFIHILEIED